MTYAPASLTELATFWVQKGGINSGIVGNAAHIAAARSYHLGKSQLNLTTAYSVKTARDKAGLTEAASAIDLGHSSKPALRSFSKWLVEECQRNAPGTRDIREVIYSPDGVVVLRYDRERGVASEPRPGEADNSHLWHTHVSYYRDSEGREKVSVFKAYWTVTEDTMPALTSYLPGYTATIKATANIRSAPGPLNSTTFLRAVPVGATETWTVTGWVKGAVDSDGGSDQWLIRWAGGRWEYTAKSNVTSMVAPLAKADLDAAVAADHAKQEARISGIKVKVAATNADIAND